MKKKQIISLGLLLILQISGTYLWSTPALFQEYSQYFSYDDSFTTGCKLDLSFAQGKFSTNFNNYNYGLNLFSEKYFKHFPCSIQIGNILIGGIISRLKNPSLDSDSGGYGNCYTEPAVITSELESFTSFSKPFSTFIELCYTDENNIIEKIKLNGSYTPSSNNANFAILGKFSTQNMISITGASGISLHFIEENKPIYWYSEIPYYSRRKSFSLGNQISINIKDLFYSNFSIFIYDSIVNKIGLVYKSENKIDLNNFTFGLSAFLNQNF